MTDMEKVIKGLQEIVDDKWMKNHADWYVSVCADTIAILEEQDETINNLNETVKNLLQQIMEIKEYMTPFGKIKDVKAYDELLKKQPDIVRCKDCKYLGIANKCIVQKYLSEHPEKIWLLSLQREWYCADGKRR